MSAAYGITLTPALEQQARENWECAFSHWPTFDPSTFDQMTPEVKRSWTDEGIERSESRGFEHRLLMQEGGLYD